MALAAPNRLRAAWCMDQSDGRIDPHPRLVSDDAVIVRACQHQHAVEDMDRHLDLGCSTGVDARAQAVTDHLLPSSDTRLDFCAPRVTGGLLPDYAAFLGNALEVTIALSARSQPDRSAPPCGAAAQSPPLQDDGRQLRYKRHPDRRLRQR